MYIIPKIKMIYLRLLDLSNRTIHIYMYINAYYPPSARRTSLIHLMYFNMFIRLINNAVEQVNRIIPCHNIFASPVIPFKRKKYLFIYVGSNRTLFSSDSLYLLCRCVMRRYACYPIPWLWHAHTVIPARYLQIQVFSEYILP